ncbi:rhomboid family protein [Leptospira ilyithenensis]|uniref:Rhomboid family intramembrane serine protease n=1 Tax=Leptospira ilyithenensis TaxID=2484901 RepID=A0A4R9LTF8_9LEPT|nr:rhomboid family intramembrane serine protease [Leptospira ilyithenensis]TGN16811.1 rhomboid family intramembrane serine protease [Leptospira ilyithenensis]
MPPRSPSGYELRFGPELTSIVRILLIANGTIFVLQFLTQMLFKMHFLEGLFALSPAAVMGGSVWQLITYSFLHVDFFHLLFNMLALWMFGSELESTWGGKPFLKFYLFASIMGGVVTLIASISGFPQGIVMGASGGIFGLLVAYAIMWPNREILFMMIFPLRAKFFVMILMLMIVFAQGGRAAHMAHLGGAIAGFILMKLYTGWKDNSSKGSSWSLSRYLQKRRFQRYQEEMYNRENAKKRVDDLLEKISREGMNSLSRSEKKFLNDASQKYFNE